MKPAERKLVEALLEAGEALHRADGEAGLRDVWRQRWVRHAQALAEVRKLIPARAEAAQEPTP